MKKITLIILSVVLIGSVVTAGISLTPQLETSIRDKVSTSITALYTKANSSVQLKSVDEVQKLEVIYKFNPADVNKEYFNVTNDKPTSIKPEPVLNYINVSGETTFHVINLTMENSKTKEDYYKQVIMIG